MKPNTALVASLVCVLAVVVPATGLAAGNAVKPAIELKTNLPGKKIIATPNKLGIYYWDTEKKAGGKIRCTGACLAEWPAVYVMHKPAAHIKGVMATFGTIKRGTRLQLTVNGLPAYTYHGDKPGIVKCDNVNGWHAVRAG